MSVEEGRRQDFSAEHRDLPRSDRHDLWCRYLTADLDRLHALPLGRGGAGLPGSWAYAVAVQARRPASAHRRQARSEVIGHLPLHAVAGHVDPLVHDLLLPSLVDESLPCLLCLVVVRRRLARRTVLCGAALGIAQ